MLLIIGSRGAKVAFNEFYRDITKSDWDIYMLKEDFKEWLSKKDNNLKSCFPIGKNKFRLIFDEINKMEVILYDNDLLFKYVENTPEIWCNDEVEVLGMGKARTLNSKCLTLLKKSHLKWNIHWDKNNNDYQWMKDNCDLSKLSPFEEKFNQLACEKMERIHKEKSLHITLEDNCKKKKIKM